MIEFNSYKLQDGTHTILDFSWRDTSLVEEVALPYFEKKAVYNDLAKEAGVILEYSLEHSKSMESPLTANLYPDEYRMFTGKMLDAFEDYFNDGFKFRRVIDPNIPAWVFPKNISPSLSSTKEERANVFIKGFNFKLLDPKLRHALLLGQQFNELTRQNIKR